jgi:hypothetical protein
VHHPEPGVAAVEVKFLIVPGNTEKDRTPAASLSGSAWKKAESATCCAACTKQARSNSAWGHAPRLLRAMPHTSARTGPGIAFHLSDYPAAWIHLGTAARLGSSIGDARLVCWSLGAQSMVARYQHRYADALDLARQGLEHTTTPLTRAQLLAWAELPALARLGTQHRSDAELVLAAARRELDADPDGEQPGRFGFDVAEFKLHVAEARLVLDDPASAAGHAQASLAHTTVGRPGWAAATLVLASSEAQRDRPDQAAELALTVLDRIPPQALRETVRQRLTILDGILGTFDQPGLAARDLHERLRILPSLVTPPQYGPKPKKGS